MVFKNKILPNRAKLGQTGPYGAKRCQTGANGAKQCQQGPNGAKPGERARNRANRARLNSAKQDKTRSSLIPIP